MSDQTEFLRRNQICEAGIISIRFPIAIGAYCEKFGYGVVRDLVGHGVGCELHEDPQIPNFIQKSRGIRLRPGMTLAIEPMVNAGRYDVEWTDDDWTVITRMVPCLHTTRIQF